MRLTLLILLLFSATLPAPAQNLFEPMAKLDPIPVSTWDLRRAPAPMETYASIAPGQAPTKLTFTKRLQRNANGTFWDWAGPAWYHKAAYAVTIGGQSGSGVLIRTNDPRKFVLLTNAHVVCRDTPNGPGPPAATIQGTRSDGQGRITGQLIAATTGPGYGQDVAMYRVTGDNLIGMPLLSRLPPAGSKVEVMGFGGPKYGTFRPFVADLIPEGSAEITLDAPSISGDSGSGMVYNGKVIGLNFGANKAVGTTAGVNMGNGQIDGIGLVWPASSDASPSFLANYVQQGCEPWGCQPGIESDPGSPPASGQPTQPGQYPGPEQFYPPAGWQNQPPAAQPQPQPQMPPASPYAPPASPYVAPQPQNPPGYGLKCPGCGTVSCPTCGGTCSGPAKEEIAEKSIDVEAKIAEAVKKYLDANADKLRGKNGSDAVVSDEMKMAIAEIAANTVVNSEALGLRIKAETDSDIQALRSEIPTPESIVAGLPSIRIEYLGRGDEVSRVEVIDLSKSSPTIKIPPMRLIQQREDGLYSIEKPLGEPAKIGVSGRVQSGN